MIEYIIAVFLAIVTFIALVRYDNNKSRIKNKPPMSTSTRYVVGFFILVIALTLAHLLYGSISPLLKQSGGGNTITSKTLDYSLTEDVTVGIAPF